MRSLQHNRTSERVKYKMITTLTMLIALFTGVGAYFTFKMWKEKHVSKPCLSFAKPSPLNAAALMNGQLNLAGRRMCEL